VLCRNAERRARKGNFPYSLTADFEAGILAVPHCAWCRVRVKQQRGKAGPTSPSLDRVIPALGYTDANTVLACHACNGEKGDLTLAKCWKWFWRLLAAKCRRGL
jgi:hypothetical protein